MAPWNASRFPYGGSIFYHFHSFRYGKFNKYSDGYRLPIIVINNLYKPYENDINTAIELLKSNGHIAKYQHDLNLFRQTLKSIKNSLKNRRFSLIDFITSHNN